MPAALWICGCAYLVCAGWLLSALHQLNGPGYALALLPGLFAAFVGLKKNPPAFGWRKNVRRFRRPFPAVFLVCAALIFLGGILYAPTNFDALTYRLPRMLNWQAAGHWMWIPTYNPRLNYSGVAWEWVAMPLLVLTRSDRGLFLINALSFLLLPGLLFSIFRKLGVARRTAWTWMWLLPLAYGYLTQAGGIGNDLTGAVFLLLSVHYGLRARNSGRAGDVWLALLAAALLTGVKLSNLPLALPCLVAAGPALGRLFKWPLASAAVATVCLLVSALPIMALNQRHTGSWTGDPHDQYKMQVGNPVAALAVNGFLLAEASLMPPLLPHSQEIHDRLAQFLPAAIRAQFPRLALAQVPEFPGEEGAGLGVGVTLPLLLLAAAAFGGIGRASRLKKYFTGLPLVVWAAWIALIFYLAKMGSEAGPRLLLPYYPLAIVPFLRLSVQGRWLRRRGWRVFLLVLALGALPVLVLSVARPLWPAVTVTSRLARAHPHNHLLQRLADAYAGYAQRNDFLAPLRNRLPKDVREIGFIAGSNDSDYTLWRPFGSRQVIYPRSDITNFLAHPDTVEWVVVKENRWAEVSPEPLAAWAAENHADIVASLPLVELISWGPEKWSLLHFTPPAGR